MWMEAQQAPEDLQKCQKFLSLTQSKGKLLRASFAKVAEYCDLETLESVNLPEDLPNWVLNDAIHQIKDRFAVEEASRLIGRWLPLEADLLDKSWSDQIPARLR